MMMVSGQFENLAGTLKKLPGVGRRTAERMAIALVVKKDSLLKEIAAALESASKTLCCCSQCGALTAMERDPCAICVDPARDSSVLCVVEDPGDVLLMERSGGYRGRYHVLMGRISPLRGQGVAQLRLDKLLKRIDVGNFEEIVLALGSDVEGDATAAFVKEALGARQIKITRPAMGLPVGGGISYADDLTIARAMNARQGL